MSTVRAQRVFIVEDDPTAAQLAEEIVRELGYEPVTFLSAERFEAHLTANPEVSGTQAIILDIVMPERDAIECMCHLRLMGISLPIILVSALGHTYFPTVRLLAAALRQEIIAAIEKPLTLDSVKSALDLAAKSAA